MPLETIMSDSNPITNLSEPLTSSGGYGNKFEFRSRRIGPSIGLRKLGMSVYVVPPGKRACPYHAHSLIEEVFIVLEGSGTVRHDGQEYPIRKGDVIAAPLGKAHQIINTSEDDLRYVALSNHEPTDVVLYPDSKKVQAYSEAFGEPLTHMTQLDDATDYYRGEE
jgi:uncharacterized cupin superfamily protein